ncbi:MAG: acetoin utilization protein AcuC [Magnetococcales bacterium]|nr:acetoin utilization protein AcuC [Magnetococcales bacterium]NGZ27547.1 acetoin utilization protein AcuC [Magnetococcales bacterium]
MTSPLKVCVHIGPQLASYGFGHGHPFSPQRMDYFWNEAKRQGLDAKLHILPPVMASREELERFHSSRYVDQVIRQSKTGDGYLDYGDTPAYEGVFESAGHVVGSVLDAVHHIMAGRYRRGFIPIAGLHHARHDRAGGFCVFNDCGVAIATLKEQYHLTRVAYVDIDAHHGDGVFYGFEEDPYVYFADTHEDGHYLYPGTGHAHEQGKGEGKGKKLNIPLPPHADDTLFYKEWQRVEAFLLEARPEFILLQCGADSIENDPITHLQLSAQAHGRAAASLCRIAESLGHGRVLAVGGGGYNPRNIAQGWCQVVSALLETPIAE